MAGGMLRNMGVERSVERSVVQYVQCECGSLLGSVAGGESSIVTV